MNSFKSNDLNGIFENDFHKYISLMGRIDGIEILDLLEEFNWCKRAYLLARPKDLEGAESERLFLKEHVEPPIIDKLERLDCVQTLQHYKSKRPIPVVGSVFGSKTPIQDYHKVLSGTLAEVFFKELKERCFFVAKIEQIKYYENKSPFGQALTKEHPELQSIGKELSEAIAFELAVSIAFLSVGAVEIMFRKLCQDKFKMKDLKDDKIRDKGLGGMLHALRKNHLPRWVVGVGQRYYELRQECQDLCVQLADLNASRNKTAHQKGYATMPHSTAIFNQSKEVIEAIAVLLTKRGFMLNK